MATQAPIAKLEPRFSTPGASPTAWSEAIETLETAMIYWLSTVKPNGQPHVTPLIAVWLDGSIYFCSGEDERKAKNIAANPLCALTTGCNLMSEGLDIVLEGEAIRVSDATKLQRIAELYKTKYDWNFEVRDGGLVGDSGNVAIAFEISPTQGFGFGKGETFSQTRWTF